MRINTENPNFKCIICGKIFLKKYNLKRHLLNLHNIRESTKPPINTGSFSCDKCDQKFKRKDILLRHSKRMHSSLVEKEAAWGKKKTCSLCDRIYSGDIIHHYAAFHVTKTDFFEYQSAFSRKYKVFRKLFNRNIEGGASNLPDDSNSEEIFESGELREGIYSVLSKQMIEHKQIRFRFLLGIQFVKFSEGFIADSTIQYLPSKFRILNLSRIESMQDMISEMINEMQSLISTVYLEGSGWVIYAIALFDIQIYAHLIPFIGANSSKTSDMVKIFPKMGINKKKLNACLANFQVPQSFKKCVPLAVAYFLFNQNFQKPLEFKNYLKIISKEFDLTGLTFPLDYGGIEKFVEQNKKFDIKISLINFDQNHFYPLGVIGNGSRIVPILVYNYQNSPFSVHHGVLITNIDRLLKTPKLSMNSNEYYSKEFFCRICLMKRYTEEGMDSHEKDCDGELEEAKTSYTIPEKKSTISFGGRDAFKTIKWPIVGFGDFESFLSKANKSFCEICKCDEFCDHKSTLKTDDHEMSSYCLLFVDINNKVVYKDSYSGENCIEYFVHSLQRAQKSLKSSLQKNRKLVMTQEIENLRLEATNCAYCGDKFENYFDKVVDHCHYTGNFLNISCKECNLARQINTIPLYFQNGTSYDFPVFFSSLTPELCEKLKVSRVISKNSVKIRTFTLWSFFVFRDSLEFLGESLEKSVKTLPNDHKFEILSQMKQINSMKDRKEKRMEMCKGKMFFPYTFFDSLDKLDYKYPPKHKDFYNDLTDKNITSEEYQTFLSTYEEFGCKKFADLVDLYCCLDVYLLAEVFIEFRNIYYNNFGLDAVQYLSLPSFAYSAFLYKTGVELETLPDKAMYDFVKSSIRGGFTFIADRYENDFEDAKFSNSGRFCSYYDINSLYLSCFKFKHGHKDFEWMTPPELEDMKNDLINDPSSIDMNGSSGYLLEISCNYPEKLHEAHDNMPFLVERMKVDETMVSDYQKNLIDDLGNKQCFKTEKLVSHLGPRKNYIAHICVIKQALEAGLELTAVHRGVKFSQSNFMNEWVEMLHEMRVNSKSQCESKNIKKVGNSVYGKFAQNVENWVTCKIVTTDFMFDKLMRSPYLKDIFVFSERLAFIFLRRKEVLLNQPLMLASGILDYSKFAYFNIFYKIFKKEFGNSLKCLLGDTDSYVISYETENLEKSLNNIKCVLDTSNMNKNDPLYSELNKNRPFFIKDESCGNSIKTVVATSPKAYAISYHDKNIEPKIACKGTSRSKFNKDLKPIDFEMALFTKCTHKTIGKRIGIDRISGRVCTFESLKISVSPLDTKRYLKNCGIHTYAYFNSKIREKGGTCFECGI